MTDLVQEARPLRPRPKARAIGESRFKPFTYLTMVFVVALTIYPLVWMLFGSLKSQGEFFTNIWSWPHSWQWHDFADAWHQGGLGVKFLNSTIATAGTLALVLPLTCMSGYATTSSSSES
jgi:raffinose/stachyose/melibiose transport system permease protein